MYLGRIFSFMQVLLKSNAYLALMIFFSILSTLRKVDFISFENLCNKFPIVIFIIFIPNFRTSTVHYQGEKISKLITKYSIHKGLVRYLDTGLQNVNVKFCVNNNNNNKYKQLTISH